MPPAKSIIRLPSTSSMTAPSARSMKTGVTCKAPCATAALRRCISSFERGPGIGVRSCMLAISVPSDGRFVEVDVDLFCFQIFVDAVRAELTPKAGLLVASPWGFDVSRLHVVDPDHSCTESLHCAQSFENIASPDCCG